MPTYRLLSETGEDMGPLRTRSPSWAPGDRIHRGGDTIEVVTVTIAEAPDDVDGYLVVRMIPGAA